jgi:hypothetical protein
MIHKLEQRLATWAETQPEDAQLTVLDYVVDWIESGNTLTQLADEVSKEMNFDISRALLTNYVVSLDPNGKRRLERARHEGAHGNVDQAIKILDNASPDKEQLIKAKQRADVRLWTAERWNKRDLGRAPDVQITVNNNTLHLDAMRMRQAQLTRQQETVRALPPSDARLISVETTHPAEDDIADVIGIEPGES